ncbi:GNAT family N-acetyltransferase [Actomonas aquatica]|uniref:GNAT family protein n=1 Tax=Actomonas aquatica TaxID=2866162 RepID=A0ABZ1C4P9_9BACT|nr:GNAT family protein [Opitutus sp. WL0086]WRQ86699.1 GNAT family protein [Opitutus sp. WL0086]
MLPLTTERLHLRRLRADEATFVHACRNLPAVARYQSWVPDTVDEVATFIATLQDAPVLLPGRWFQLAIARRSDDTCLGDIALSLDAQDPTVAEFGIALHPDHQGAGLAREAMAALIAHVFAHSSVRRWRASVDPRNTASIRLCTALGFHRHALIPRAFEIRGEWVDDAVYFLDRPQTDEQNKD